MNLSNTSQNERTKKGDFVEIKYTGTAFGEVFDSNISEDVKKINPQQEPRKTIVVIGERMVVEGLDNALNDKELNKEYTIHLSPKEAFGERNRNLLKTIPQSVFTKHKINLKVGSTLVLDNYLVKIVAHSGARVIADFNNPLAGKAVDYRFKIVRLVADIKEKIEAYFSYFWKYVPEFEIKENTIIVKIPSEFKKFVDAQQEIVKKLLDKSLVISPNNKPKEHSPEATQQSL